MPTSHAIHSDSYDSVFGFRVTGTEWIVYTVISFVAILFSYDKWKRKPFQKLADKLDGPPGYPIIGLGLEGFANNEKHYKRIIQFRDLYIHHDIWKIWAGNHFVVVLSRPEDLKIILNSPKALHKSFVYDFFSSLLGKGLITAPVDLWKKHRRLINPLFKFENLKEMFFPVFVEKSEILIQTLQKEVGKKQPFDIFEYISDITLSTICQTTMNYNLDIDSDMGSEFKTYLKKGYETIIFRVFRVLLYPDMIYSIYSKIFKLDNENIFKRAKNLPSHIIAKMQEEHVEMKKERVVSDVNDGKNKRLKVLMDILFELNESGANLSDDDIKSEVITIITAGMETSALTVSFCLLLLAIYPDIQDKVYDEICSVYNDDDDGPITIQHTTKFVYLKQVIYETLRLFPVVPFMLRELQDDVKIFSGNHTLPKGTTCVVSPVLTHHIPELYPDHESFNPDNFNADNVARRHKYSFMSFSGGPRGCIGMKYGLLNIIVLVTTILRNFSVHTDIKLTDIKLKFDLVLRSVNGFPVTIRPRGEKQ